jgi:hypothetical protein
MPAVKSKPKPQATIRRFDIFAEYNRNKAMGDGLPADQAKGYGLWLAKIVAARRFAKSKTEPDDRAGEAHAKDKPARRTKWRSLSGVPQTAKLFDKEIVGRMGSPFYRRVFAPAVRAALKRGESYESIRDSLRANWKPED